MKCYDEWWLDTDMNRMGYLFEYCDKYCNEILGIDRNKINKVKLLTAFMKSRFRKEMEQGHPKFLSQASYDSIKQWISVDYNNDISQFLQESNNKKFEQNQLYWIGWIYAYIHFVSKLSSKEIIKRLPIKTMLQHYALCHEISKESYYKRIEDQLK